MGIGIALALAACGGAQRKDDAPVVVSAIGATAEPSNPNAGPLDEAQRVALAATAQGLVRFDAAGGIEPGLAERWIVIDDGRSYIFRLRPGTWSDGTPVTATQVVQSLRRTAASNRNSLAPFLAVIDEIVEMTPQVIEVRLRRPRPDLLKLFAQPEMAIFRERARGGSGPFDGDAQGSALLLTPRPDPGKPRDAATPQPEDTVLLRGERAALALARFNNNTSDLIMGGSFANWPLVKQAGIAPAKIRFDPAIGMFGLVVLHRNGFLADAANRSAVAMAINRPALLRAVHPDWQVSETLLPAKLDSAEDPAQPGWSPLSSTARRETARQRVALWKRTSPAPVILRIALPHGPGATLVWAHLASGLRSVGIEARRVALDADAELRLVDAVAPYDSGRWFIATACKACSPDASALIEAAREASDLPTRALRIAQADAALMADSAYIPIAQPMRWSVVGVRLRTWRGNTRAWHPLNHLRNETE